MLLSVNLIKATVIRSNSTDRICLYFDGKSPFPSWLPNTDPFFVLETAKGYGEPYLRNELKITEYEVIEI